MAGDPANSDSSPNKRLKAQSQNSKSKSKLEDADEENQRWRENSACAICYVEDGKAIRGEIDCCEHYFCFICIIEWAKTESRCPLCRRRFTTIRRPPKHGAFARERLIKVPVRDQAFIHSGDTNDSFDPYAEVLCHVCHQTTDENLLLLCDLCDSGAHTYCVGLGYTVPEGDWFCHDCTISKAECASSETITEYENQNSIEDSGIADIVKAPHRVVVEKPPSRVYSDSNRSLSPSVSCQGAGASVVVTCTGTRTIPSVTKKLSEPGARTLDHCRSVHSRIRALREHWNALQRGSLSFSSSSFKPHCYSQKQEDNAVLRVRSSQVESSFSRSCEQLKDHVGIGSYNIDRAWKMMDIAKSKQCRRGKSSSLQTSKPPVRNASTSKERTNLNLSNLIKCQQLGIQNPGKTEMEKPCKPHSFGKELIKHQSPELEREKQSRAFIKEVPGCSSSLSTTSSPTLFEPSLSKNVFTSTGGNSCKENRSILLRKNVDRTSSNITSEKNHSLYVFPVRQGTSHSFDVKSEPSASSSKVDVPKGDTRLKHGCVETKVTEPDGAKCEIQSLVKLNLKLLTADKRLGVAAFKEIARLATHTILAACGLEHKRKYGFYSFPNFVCSHTELFEKLPRSNIMPESCQECFYSFVNNVVNSIMLEKVDCTKFS